MKYQKGEVYYQLTYPEMDMLYPKIESFVFLGKNLSPEDSEQTWYFQFVDSYAKHGSVLASNSGDRKVVSSTKKELEQMLDLDGLIINLKAAMARRKKLNKI